LNKVCPARCCHDPSNVDRSVAAHRSGLVHGLVSLQSQIKSVEDTYGIDNLHLTVATGYVAKLLGNARVVRWLAQNRHEYLSEFQSVAEIETVPPTTLAAE
jgi:hypothetical protein